jgi:hypothetical protein
VAGAAGAPAALLLAVALSLAGVGLEVEDAGVLGLLLHPSARVSANNAAAENKRGAFTNTPFVNKTSPEEL